jgi:hypothetical protein
MVGKPHLAIGIIIFEYTCQSISDLIMQVHDFMFMVYLLLYISSNSEVIFIEKTGTCTHFVSTLGLQFHIIYFRIFIMQINPVIFSMEYKFARYKKCTFVNNEMSEIVKETFFISYIYIYIYTTFFLYIFLIVEILHLFFDFILIY